MEWEALLLLGIVGTIYLLRLPEMSVRGEESRWGTVAMEMIRGGDWIVPRQQGVPFLSRPPLGSWLIAGATLLRGQCDVWAVRLPAVLATLLTSLLVYGYSRAFLSRAGALSSGLAYATMGQVLQLGRVGETEAVFTLLVSASLLVWHWAYVKQWGETWMWVAGYSMAALGALAKGPQAPVYLVAVTSVFLVLRGEWRRLLTWPHGVGVAVFGGIVACWQIPFFLKLGWSGTKTVWASDTAMRLWEIQPEAIAKHMVSYPLEIIGCTLPWSLFLFVFLSRKCRMAIGLGQASGVSHDTGPRCMASFLLTCLAVTFPTCWLIPGAHGRYFMPLFPCIAPLIGLVLEHCIKADAESMLGRIWRNNLAGASVVIVGFALAVTSASWLGFPKVSLISQARDFSLIYAASALIFAVFLSWSRGRSHRGRGLTAVCAIAAFLGLTYDTVVLNFLVQKNGVTAEQVARLKEQLPEGQSLVSLGPIHHLFAFHYREPISLKAWPVNKEDAAPSDVYFCFERGGNQPLPFAWEEVAAISCDRDRTPEPEEVVIVGRRLRFPSSLTSFRSDP